MGMQNSPTGSFSEIPVMCTAMVFIQAETAGKKTGHKPNTMVYVYNSKVWMLMQEDWESDGSLDYRVRPSGKTGND